MTRKKRPSDQRPSALVREREARWGALPSKPRSYSMTCCMPGRGTGLARRSQISALAAAQRSHDQRHRPGCRRAKHQESQNCIRMNHDIIKMKQALVGPRLVDQPGPYGLGPRERWFRNPPAKCAENGRRFHY